MTRIPARPLAVWLQRTLGRRGATLLALAAVDLVIAWLLVNPDLHAQTMAVPSYRIIVHLPLELWGAAWAAVGLVCAVQAWRRTDRVAFGLAISIKVVWSSLILAAWLWAEAPLAWAGAVVWGALAAWVATAAGWPEPPESH